MRIQHNIMAMSAYRNYNNNTSAVAKNLEKLSSGYKINRAGDDAAGLAISEKMRAQITGLNAAQKNVKDGISLVKTAEGAMQEIQDMLNRMDYLATQSANGTYQDEVDREALQKEVNQLCDEINRIADSANFNGIKLLDGSLDSEIKKIVNDATLEGLKGAVYNPQGEGKVNGAGTGAVQGWAVYTHKDAVAEAKTAFTVNLSDLSVSGLLDADGNPTQSAIQLVLDRGNDTNAITKINGQDSPNGLQALMTADKDGNISGKDIAAAMAKLAGATETEAGKVTLTNQSGVAIEYNVTAEGDTLRFEMTDKGYADAVKAYGEVTGENDAKNWVFNGNYNIKVSSALGGNPTGTIQGNKDNSTSVIQKGTAASGTQLADVISGYYVKGPASPQDEGQAQQVQLLDGSGIKVGDTAYVFAGTDETFNGEYGSNVKVVDIRDIYDAKANELKSENDINTALSRLTDAAKDNKMFDVQLNNGSGDWLCFREKEDYNGDGKDGRADLTTEKGINEQIQRFTSIKANVDVKKAKGKALQLQIGDTSESFNQLKVSVGDMHTKALGIDGLNIGNAASAADAINTIKNAINTVSSVRGDLGAYQNRLEHTANNLSVMAENIQDAESSIRDTDIAEEMMSYTKNNILVQSAQAMLAQANQVPQGVLQLLG